jgi:hypothetical protein
MCPYNTKSTPIKITAFIFSFLLAFPIFGAEQALTIDKAIEHQSNYIIERSPDNISIAIIYIYSPDTALSSYIMLELPNYIINNGAKKLTVIERIFVEDIEEEIHFQNSGTISDETAVSIGKMTGARFGVIGIVTETGNTLRFNIKILDIETGETTGSNSCDIKIDGKVKGLFRESGQKTKNNTSTASRAPGANSFLQWLKDDEFISGWYAGYLFSPSMPFGISFGYLAKNFSILMTWAFVSHDFSFSFPDSQGYSLPFLIPDKITEHTFSFDYSVDGYTQSRIEWVPTMSIPLYAPFLWLNAGFGFQWVTEYVLVTSYRQTNTGYGYDSYQLQNNTPQWYEQAANTFFVFHPKIHVRIKHLLFTAGYKYVFDILDIGGGGSDFSIGLNYIWY